MFLLNLAQRIMHCEVERMETNAYLGPLLCLLEVAKDVVGRHLTLTDVFGSHLTEVVKSGESLSNVGPILSAPQVLKSGLQEADSLLKFGLQEPDRFLRPFRDFHYADQKIGKRLFSEGYV